MPGDRASRRERERGNRLEEREKQHWWKEEMAWVHLTIGKINT
jgi:hypothetical protein